jgi:hypothetical protein
MLLRLPRSDLARYGTTPAAVGRIIVAQQQQLEEHEASSEKSMEALER